MDTLPVGIHCFTYRIFSRARVKNELLILRHKKEGRQMPCLRAYERRFVMRKLFRKVFLDHPQSTDKPQGYWAHGKYSIINSIKGIFYMKLGILHGIFPILFPFSTSSWIIRSFVQLVESDRHKKEIDQYISTEVVRKMLRNKKMYEKKHWWTDS